MSAKMQNIYIPRDSSGNPPQKNNKKNIVLSPEGGCHELNKIKIL